MKPEAVSMWRLTGSASGQSVEVEFFESFSLKGGQMPVENFLHRGYVHPVMLEDRPYMRRRSLVPRRSATVTLLLVNVAAFLLQQFLPGFSAFWSHQSVDQ